MNLFIFHFVNVETDLRLWYCCKMGGETSLGVWSFMREPLSIVIITECERIDEIPNARWKKKP
jgi:hypothetical protein